MNICINPGHCPGLDPGAVGRYSTEADIVRKIGFVLEQDMKNIGFNTLVVQENELETICAASNNMPADLFVSIHCNSASDPRAVGTEVFHYYGASQASVVMAGCVQNQLINTLGTVDRGVKEAGFYVIKYTNCPAILVETAFISNPAEEDMLNNNIETIAHAIARGITDALQQLG